MSLKRRCCFVLALNLADGQILQVMAAQGNDHGPDHSYLK